MAVPVVHGTSEGNGTTFLRKEKGVSEAGSPQRPRRNVGAENDEHLRGILQPFLEASLSALAGTRFLTDLILNVTVTDHRLLSRCLGDLPRPLQEVLRPR